ncbi:PREDICTED: uncharacterized protein LOC104822307 [Tarenaya hassleriana]|uniref:uncharacterized protein LOC104822307 n=1 Tax=Tarenaya hassleriana TaxID=28532 RepID=UPI00053C1F63|nr:PREDICTED: uncharacterized protein LOC104822307 [Tarenaya hassleriana]
MELAMEVEVEDDVFFADISRQISLLIMDEEDEHVSSSLSPLQGLLGGSAVSPSAHEQSCRRRESKGTGVFIPRSSQPRRKHHHHQNQGRFSSFSSNPQSHPQRQRQQQHDNSSTVHASNPRRTYRDAASVST